VEHVDQRLAVLDHERRLRRSFPAARRDHLGEPPAARRAFSLSSVAHGPPEAPALFIQLLFHFLIGVNSSVSSEYTTTASILAGSVLLAFSSRVCRSPCFS